MNVERIDADMPPPVSLREMTVPALPVAAVVLIALLFVIARYLS